MEVIDFHAHIYPEKIAAKAAESIGEFYNIRMEIESGTSEELLKAGKNVITAYTVHSVAVTGHHVSAINDYIASEIKKHENFYGFGTMHADFEEKIAEVQRMKLLGLRGIKIHPDTQGYNMDDPRMFEMYDYIASEGIPLLIHCGDYRYTYSHPTRLKHILREFPKLNVVAAHFGGWSMPDLALEYIEDERCYVDLSSSFAFTGMRHAKELIQKYGAERVVFGSDFPMWDPVKELEAFLSLKFSNEENELILSKNAKQILGI